MKVILVNGSPHEKGCTYTALKEVEKTLNQNEIETEIFWLGNKPVARMYWLWKLFKNRRMFCKR